MSQKDQAYKVAQVAEFEIDSPFLGPLSSELTCFLLYSKHGPVSDPQLKKCSKFSEMKTDFTQPGTSACALPVTEEGTYLRGFLGQ